MIRSLLPVQLNSVWVALDAGYIQEIMGLKPWVPIPGASSRVPGILGWRGRAVGVLDLASQLGMGAGLNSGEGRDRTVVVLVGAVTLAIPVDAVREVHEVQESQIKPVTGGATQFATSQIELGGVPVPIIDLPAITHAVAGQNAEAA
jgi:chemotaxis signal transduction protein